MRLMLPSTSVLALVTLGCIVPGDGHTSVNGKVVDTDGNPVSGAKATLTELESSGPRKSYSMTTEADGGYGVGITHEPTTKKRFRFEVSKEGFVTHKEELTGTAQYKKDIVLRRE